MVTVGHGCEPPTYVGTGTERTGDWTTHLEKQLGTGSVRVSIDNRIFETGGELREGEKEVLHLKGLTLSGVESFEIEVGGNRRVKYHISGKSTPTGQSGNAPVGRWRSIPGNAQQGSL